MSNEWEVARVTGRCAATGRELAEGESYYAVLMETPAGLERRDFSVAAWTSPPEGTFCHWKGRIPVRQKRHGPVSLDPELLTQLFLALESADSEPMQQLRFVLGLLLLRKRLVRMEGTVQQEGREYWQLRLLSDGGIHQVPNPQLTGEQVERLSAQLLGLLSGELDAVALAEQPAGSFEKDPAKAEDDTDVSGPPHERQENLATS
jgi:hypothetical protein